MVTPFAADGNVDVAALRRLTEHLVTGGVEYLVPLGTTGEGSTLTNDEKLLVLDTVFETNANRARIIVGNGGSNTRSVAATMAAWTQRYNPFAFLSVSPAYNKPTQAGIVAHFKAVASETDKPIMLYNVPGRTASNMTADTTLELAHSVPNILAIKEASGDLEQGMLIIRNKPVDFAVFSGDDLLALPQIAAGYDGVVSVIGNSLPRQYSDLVRHAVAGDFAVARAIQYTLIPTMQLNFREGNPAGVKAALELLGVCSSAVRLPLVAASAELRKAQATALQTAGAQLAQPA
jgi:4-hydroxy-tetrahydrodipicolinate synthase